MQRARARARASRGRHEPPLNGSPGMDSTKDYIHSQNVLLGDGQLRHILPDQGLASIRAIHGDDTQRGLSELKDFSRVCWG